MKRKKTGRKRSPIMEVPIEARDSVQRILYKPRFLARLLRERAKRLREYEAIEKQYASQSVVEVNGVWVKKSDYFKAEAKKLLTAAKLLDPIKSAPQQKA